MISIQQDHELRGLLVQIVEARTLAFREGRGRPEWGSIVGRMPFEDVCRIAKCLNIETRELELWWQRETPSFLLWVTALDERIAEGYTGESYE